MTRHSEPDHLGQTFILGPPPLRRTHHCPKSMPSAESSSMESILLRTSPH